MCFRGLRKFDNFHHSVFYKIQRIPFNRLLTAFLKALFQQALVEQIQRIPFNRPLTVFLRALFQQASVEQIQRIPLNRLLMVILGVLSWRCIVDACFSDLGGLPEIDNFLLQLPLQLTAFRLRAWGGTSGGLFGSVFVDYANSTIFHHSVFYKI